jgi:hypothetical protein
MLKKKNKVVLFQSTGGDFIDLLDTGSFIRYKAIVTLKKNAESSANDYISSDFTMSLGDCSRVINWDFEDYDDDEFKFDKIDLAISILKQARVDMVKCQKIANVERARIAKDKAKVKEA